MSFGEIEQHVTVIGILLLAKLELFIKLGKFVQDSHDLALNMQRFFANLQDMEREFQSFSLLLILLDSLLSKTGRN